MLVSFFDKVYISRSSRPCEVAVLN